MADIGEILFREALGMSSYPGSPFTGDIFRDVILFFFVPTVFLIIFVYLASAIAVHPGHVKMRMLMAIAIYAFIIASRYYEGFAIFASQFYFVFLIFVGIIYFAMRHFRAPGGGTRAYRGGARAYEDHGQGEEMSLNIGHLSQQFQNPARRRLKEVRQELDALRKRHDQVKGTQEGSTLMQEIILLEREERDLRRELGRL